MNGRKTAVACGVLMLMLALACRADDRLNDGEDLRQVVANNIHVGDGLSMKAIMEPGTNAVPYIIPYLEDSDAATRESAAILLGCLGDARAIPPLVKALMDQDRNVRRRSIVALDKITTAGPVRIDEAEMAGLVQCARGVDDQAHLAIMILGRVAGPEYIPIVKEIFEGATSQVAAGGGMAVIGNRKTDACLKALARLGDLEARNRVRLLLQSQSAGDRAQGIEIVSYVGKAMTDELIPLLTDQRDAADISPSMAGDYFLRVCDLAADAIREVYPVEMESQKRTRYADDDLQALQKRLTAHCQVNDKMDARYLALRSYWSDGVVRARVHDVKSVRKAIKIVDGEIVADVLSYGRLATVRPIDIQWRKSDSFKLPDPFYIYQEGASPSLHDARMEKDGEYVMFLKEEAVPEIATSGMETDPIMPTSHYYSIVEMRWGCIPVSDTGNVARIKAHFRPEK